MKNIGEKSAIFGLSKSVDPLRGWGGSVQNSVNIEFQADPGASNLNPNFRRRRRKF